MKTIQSYHEVGSGYRNLSGELDSVLNDKTLAEHFASCFDAATEFASNPLYVQAAQVVSSQFFKNGYRIAMECEFEKDERNRGNIKKTFVVDDLSERDDYEMPQGIVIPDSTYFRLMSSAALMAAVNPKTTLAVIVDGKKSSADDVLALIKTMIGKELSRRLSYIEAIGDLPMLEADVIICRTLASADKDNFIAALKKRANCSVFDMTGDFTAEVTYFNLTFAQSCIKKIYETTPEKLPDVSAQFDKVMAQFPGIAGAEIGSYYDLIAYLVLTNFHKEMCPCLQMTTAEKKVIAQLIASIKKKEG